jgi:hypothetical protein
MILKGSDVTLYCIPRLPPPGFRKGSRPVPGGRIVRGAAWVASPCFYAALTDAEYETRTIQRHKGQSPNMSLLEGPTRQLPDICTASFGERWDSLTGGSLLDTEWPAAQWAQFWCETIPPRELHFLRFSDPAFLQRFLQQGTPRFPYEANTW